jgi:hypothetical protein
MGRSCKEPVSSICRVVLISLCVALITACGALGGTDDSDSGSGSGSGSASARTELTISAWPRGTGGPMRSWTLTCEPAGGSLPRAAAACRRLTPASLRPLPRGTICTQIYGGPQVARVRGRLAGKPVDARFNRTNGCEIHRWNQVRFLLAPG